MRSRRHQSMGSYLPSTSAPSSNDNHLLQQMNLLRLENSTSPMQLSPSDYEEIREADNEDDNEDETVSNSTDSDDSVNDACFA